MFIRIARFEGGTTAEIEAEAKRIRGSIETARRGESSTEIPAELTRLSSRVEVLLDRVNGAVALLVSCETEEQLREVDRIMDDMSPTSGEWGRRVSVDLYEVYFDEATSLTQAA